MLRKSLLILFSLTSLFVCTEAYSFGSSSKEKLPLRHAFKYSPNIYVEVFGAALPDRILPEFCEDQDEDSEKSIADTKSKQSHATNEKKPQSSHSSRKQGSEKHRKIQRRKSSGDQQDGSSFAGLKQVRSLFSSKQKKSSSQEGLLNSKKEKGNSHAKSSAPTGHRSHAQAVRRTQSEAPLSKKDKKTKKAVHDEQLAVLNQLMRDHQWLAGIIVGYRIDNQTACEVKLPVGKTSPFYTLPSVSYKYLSSGKAGSASFYGKAGLALGIARLKVKRSVARPVARNIDEYIADSESISESVTQNIRLELGGINTGTLRDEERDTQEDKKDDGMVNLWKCSSGFLAEAGLIYPVHSNFNLDISAHLLYPFTQNEPKSSQQLPFGLIGSIQLAVHFKLG